RVAHYGIPRAVRQVIAGAWNGTIADLADKHGALVVDLYRHWPVAQTPEFVCSDGFHPSTAGYRALAEVFHAALRENRIIGDEG
ncbi:MAG TPA: hypothetical protein VGW38_19130, partial [Chloroflexota bacterium]|nr:hypothetical protein [Chloroflexota bacterium]